MCPVRLAKGPHATIGLIEWAMFLLLACAEPAAFDRMPDRPSSEPGVYTAPVDIGNDWPEGLQLLGPVFVRTEPGCTSIASLALRNGGPEDLEFWVVATGPFSAPAQVTVPADRQVEMPIEFSPGDEGPVNGTLWLTGSETSDAVILKAESGYATIQETQFTATHGDVLLLLDQSASMEDNRDRLLQNANVLLDGEGRVFVATDDLGTAPEVTTQTEVRLAASGRGGELTEALFSIAANAVRAGAPGSGPLHLVFVSDESEQSPAELGGTDGQLAAARSLVPEARFHAIVGPVPTGGDCAYPGDGYFQATTETDARFFDICDLDYSNTLGLLVEETMVLPTQQYVGGAVDVLLLVDGEPWPFVRSANIIRFDEPPWGSVVELTTWDAQTCDN